MLSGNTASGQGLKIYLGLQRGGRSPVGDLIMQHTVGREEQTEGKKPLAVIKQAMLRGVGRNVPPPSLSVAKSLF